MEKYNKPITTADNPNAAENNTLFEGYTISEIKYQRALAALRMEFCKDEVLKDICNVKSRIGLGDKDKTGKKGATVMNLAGKALSGLNYLDYFMLGISVISTGRKIFGLFRKRK
jgi:hypothetical protein